MKPWVAWFAAIGVILVLSAVGYFLPLSILVAVSALIGFFMGKLFT